MRISIVAIFLVIFVKCTDGSLMNIHKFKNAVDEGDLETVVDMCRQGIISNVNYVIEKAAPNFIINFIKQFNLIGKCVLAELCTVRSMEVIKQVNDQVEFPQTSLIYAASEPVVFCSPERMNYFLTKMRYPESVRRTIREGIWILFNDGQTHQIPSTLHFFEGRILLGVSLRNIAIQSVFLEGAGRHDKGWISYCEEHPAIDSMTYGDALVYAGKKGLQTLFFQRLLTNADGGDLNAALSSKIEGSRDEEFRAVIETALFHSQCREVTVRNFSIMIAWMARKILDKNSNITMPRAIIDIIIPYITDERLPARRDTIENVNLVSVKEEEQFTIGDYVITKICYSSVVYIEGHLEDYQERMIMTLSVQLPILLRELMEDGHHDTICNIVRMGGNRFHKYLYPLVTTLKDYTGVYECLQENEKCEEFLVQGAEAGVAAVIKGIERGSKLYIDNQRLSWAIYSASFGEYRRAVHLLVASKDRYEMENGGIESVEEYAEFSKIVYGRFFLPSSDLSARVKGFLVLHGDELNEKHPLIHQTFCRELGEHMERSFDGEQVREFLADLARQPIPLSVGDFAKGLLSKDGMSEIPYYLEGSEWRELHEALIFGDQGIGEKLWSIMKGANYSGNYPSTNEARQAFLEKIKSKKTLEQGWIAEKSSAILTRLGEDVPLILPLILLGIIAEYAIDWQGWY